MPQTPVGLYIHWPFCPYRCFFCPFVALAGQDEYMGIYQRALNQEILDFFAKNHEKTAIETIFIGGGTPSSWPPDLLLDTFGILNRAVTFVDHHEVTLEVNPGTVTSEKIDAWVHAGINRISMGVQSLNEAVLTSLNRHHTIRDVYSFLQEFAHRFQSLSIDLILGLPGISEDAWRATIGEVIKWPINHISVYFLTVHEDTRLYYGVQQQQFILPTDEAMVTMYLWTIEQLNAAGFEQYEISNFAKPGHQSRHNKLYWERKPYKGFGLGACSFDGAVRTQNDKNLMSYIATTMDHQSPVVQTETLTPQQHMLEHIMLSMRQRQGIHINTLIQEKPGVMQDIIELHAAQLVHIQNNRVSLTPRGRTVENEIIVRLTRH